jgi:hypothetical protein
MTGVPLKPSALAQRVKPAGAAFVGLLVLGLNVMFALKGSFFFPFGTLLGCALFLAGGFGVIVGEPDDPYGIRPTWFKVGIGACAIIGVVIGLFVNAQIAA